MDRRRSSAPGWRPPRRAARRRGARAAITETVSSRRRLHHAGPRELRGGSSSSAHGIQRVRAGRSPHAADREPRPVAEGHAWIASGYRAREYQHPHLFIEDLVALRELFLKETGSRAGRSSNGQSMGGHITVASRELRRVSNQGCLSECGSVDGIGSPTTDGVTPPRRADLRCAYPRCADRQAFGPLLEGVVRALGMAGSYTARGRDRQRRAVPDGCRSRRQRPCRCASRGSRRGTAQHHAPPKDVENEPNTGPARGEHRPRQCTGSIPASVSTDELNASRQADPPVKDAVRRPPTRVRGADGPAHGAPPHAAIEPRCMGPLSPSSRTGDRTMMAGRTTSSCSACAPRVLRRRRSTRRQRRRLVAWIERGGATDGEDVLAADLSRVGLKWTPYLHPEDPLAARR